MYIGSTMANSKAKIAAFIAGLAALMGLMAVPTASAASIYDTGPHSYNSIKYNSNYNYKKINFNYVSVNNYNHQYARSGDAFVVGNTHGGWASTGNATNNNTTNTWINISN